MRGRRSTQLLMLHLARYADKMRQLLRGRYWRLVIDQIGEHNILCGQKLPWTLCWPVNPSPYTEVS